MTAFDIFDASSWETRDRTTKNTDNGIWLCDRGSQALAVSIVFTCLATCFVSARVYTRRCLIKHMQPNDWMVVVALIFSFIFMSFFIVEAIHGMGMYRDDLPRNISREQLKSFYLTIPFYNLSLFCAKASILLQYHRVFPTRTMRLTCTFFLALLATYGTWAVVSAFLTCIPVAKFWEPITGGYCLNTKALWFSNACMHIFTDLAVLVIPIPALKGLGLPLRQRVGIILIFALGGFVCITSIIRLLTLNTISESTDPTYDNVGAATWSAIECNTGIICACLPTLRPLISKIIPGFLIPTTSYKPRTRTTRSLNPIPVPVVSIPGGDGGGVRGGGEGHSKAGQPHVQIRESEDDVHARPNDIRSQQDRGGSLTKLPPPAYHRHHYNNHQNFLGDKDIEAGGYAQYRGCAVGGIPYEDDEYELEEERMLAFVQQRKLGCRWSKESNAAVTDTTMTTTTTMTLRGDERWSSVSSGPTVKE